MSGSTDQPGEIVSRRSEPDAGLHFEGTGEAVWGTKFVLVAVRSEHEHGRILLDVEWVATPGGEAATALDCFTRLTPLVPGAQGVIYDGAFAACITSIRYASSACCP